MPESSDVYQPSGVYQPTTQLPVVEPRGVYRAANHRRTALIAAAGSVGVLLALVVWLFPGDDDPQPRAITAAPPSVALSAGTPEASETPEAEEPAEITAAPTTPTTAATTQRPATAAELINGLTAVVDALEDQDQLDDDGAEALNRRLEQAAKRLSRGDAKGASRKIDEFTKKLDDLRKDEDITQDAFELLRTGARQVKAGL